MAMSQSPSRVPISSRTICSNAFPFAPFAMLFENVLIAMSYCIPIWSSIRTLSLQQGFAYARLTPCDWSENVFVCHVGGDFTEKPARTAGFFLG
jgi:hypothetical protein